MRGVGMGTEEGRRGRKVEVMTCMGFFGGGVRGRVEGLGKGERGREREEEFRMRVMGLSGGEEKKKREKGVVGIL